MNKCKSLELINIIIISKNYFANQVNGQAFIYQYNMINTKFKRLSLNYFIYNEIFMFYCAQF
jgi:hypothetical protein